MEELLERAGGVRGPVAFARLLQDVDFLAVRSAQRVEVALAAFGVTGSELVVERAPRFVDGILDKAVAT